MSRKANYDYLDRTRLLAVKALGAGGELVSTSGNVRWDISGSCMAGYSRVRHARPETDRPVPSPATEGSAVGPKKPVNEFCMVELITRCRKCEACRKARQRLWRLRMSSELGLAQRNWFGTLTLSPEWHATMWERARVRYDRREVDVDTLPSDVQFRVRTIECQAEITRWLKRVRKGDRTQLRYVVVAEAHKNGLPHFHCLVHELPGRAPVRHQTLKAQWRLGFVNFKLVPVGDTRAAAYVAKYLAKSALARIRASIQYGSGGTSNGLAGEYGPYELTKEPSQHQKA